MDSSVNSPSSSDFPQSPTWDNDSDHDQDTDTIMHAAAPLASTSGHNNHAAPISSSSSSTSLVQSSSAGKKKRVSLGGSGFGSGSAGGLGGESGRKVSGRMSMSVGRGREQLERRQERQARGRVVDLGSDEYDSSEDEMYGVNADAASTLAFEASRTRRHAATILDSPELIMMYAAARQDSIAGTKHYFTKMMCGFLTEADKELERSRVANYGKGDGGDGVGKGSNGEGGSGKGKGKGRDEGDMGGERKKRGEGGGGGSAGGSMRRKKRKSGGVES